MDHLDLLVQMAIQEDVGHGDVTTLVTVDEHARGKAMVFGREPFVLSGFKAFRKVFAQIDPEVEFSRFYSDGDHVPMNEPVLSLEGRARSLLTGERTALNLLQRLCGVATMTRRMVDAMKGATCRLLDTRKTTPLWRALEKEAVRHGGGFNHRFGLSDGILIKDNHIGVVGSVRESVRRARQSAPHCLKVEVEVETIQQLQEAIHAGADIVLLDNFSLEMLGDAVRLAGGRVLLEASGGVNLDSIGSIARTGVDFVSCGALTHSARAIDLTMEFTLA